MHGLYETVARSTAEYKKKEHTSNCNRIEEKREETKTDNRRQTSNIGQTERSKDRQKSSKRGKNPRCAERCFSRRQRMYEWNMQYACEKLNHANNY